MADGYDPNLTMAELYAQASPEEKATWRGRWSGGAPGVGEYYAPYIPEDILVKKLRIAKVVAEIEALKKVQPKPEDWIGQWLYKIKMDDLRSSLQRAKGHPERMETYYPPLGRRKMGSYRDLLARASEIPTEDFWGRYRDLAEVGKGGFAGVERGGYQSSLAPVPSWLTPFLEPTMAPTSVYPAERQRLLMRKGLPGRGVMPLPGGEYTTDIEARGGISPRDTARSGFLGQRGGAFAIRPLGAQAELTPERMSSLMSYLGWTKAGAPRDIYIYLERMAEMPKWWERYQRQAQKLFPTGRLPQTQWFPPRR